MKRIRLTLISAAMVASLAVLTLSSMAQPPGGRQGGGAVERADLAAPAGLASAAPADPFSAWLLTRPSRKS